MNVWTVLPPPQISYLSVHGPLQLHAVSIRSHCFCCRNHQEKPPGQRLPGNQNMEAHHILAMETASQQTATTTAQKIPPPTEKQAPTIVENKFVTV
eukprot:4621944-Amphidinium_carterae.1